MIKKLLFFTIFLLINYIAFIICFKKIKLSLHHYKNRTVFKRKDLEHIKFTADSHIHFSSFNSKTNFKDILEYLQKSNILMCICMGIGQTFPVEKNCKRLSECNIHPSINNDVINAINYYNYNSLFNKKLIICMSMTFLDLNNPSNIPIYIRLFDRQFPKLFRSVGEVNLCKQSIKNKQFYVPIHTIYKWKPFMDILYKRNMPIFIHCDLGNDQNNTKYLYLLESVCKLYPHNKIIWCHLGICPQLKNIDTQSHIKIVSKLLDNYNNLYCDISWDILYHNYFKFTEKRLLYINFLNKYYNRVLVGSDFVYHKNTSYSDFLKDYNTSGYICQYLNNRAYRHIALGQNFINIMNIVGLIAPDII